ncbi:MAG: hypothetical protein LBV71_16105 [Prevotella sp.]|jgi:hypothetical protein|nr:hypothetical protein [Prevotella sp.]
MGIYSTNDISSIYIGGTNIIKVFAGDIQVFPAAVIPPVTDEIVKVGFSDEIGSSEMVYVTPSGQYIMGLNNYESPNTYYTTKVYSINNSLSTSKALTSTAKPYAGSVIGSDLYIYTNNSSNVDFIYKYNDATSSFTKINSSTTKVINNIFDIDGVIYAVGNRYVFTISNNNLVVLADTTTSINFYYGVKIGSDIIFNAQTGMYKYNGSTTTKILNFGSVYKPYFANNKYYYPYGSGSISAFYVIDENLIDSIKSFTDFTIVSSTNKLPIQMINGELFLIAKSKSDSKFYLYKLNADDTYTQLVQVDLSQNIEMYYFNDALYVQSNDITMVYSISMI